MLLDIQNLHITFDKKKAVDAISFSIKEGETLGVVGESGSGKSVTALSILDLLPKNAFVEKDAFLFNDNNLIDKDLAALRGKDIAIIFQEQNALNPVLTCGEQIEEVLVQHKKTNKNEAKTEIFNIIEQVKLPNPERIYNAYPHQLSGGQQQRIMIAMAIACRPKLLIADEPTTALDASTQTEILQLLNELKGEYGLSMLFISHDLNVIAQIADKVAVMRNGKIVEQGDIKSIFENPQHPYTKGLIACRPEYNKNALRLPTVEDFLEGKNSVLEEKYSEKRDFSTKKAVLKVENLIVKYPVKNNFFGKPTAFIDAVKNVSFELFEGETLGIVGESGSGKSSLAKAILRLIPAQNGQVFYQNQDIFQVSEEEMRLLRKDISIVFQNPYTALNPRKTIGESLIEPLEIHNIGKNKAERHEKALNLLEKVQLNADFFHRFPKTLSGGQLQRVVIARALTTSPKVLICDECVSALDVSIQAQILNLLKDLQAQFGLSYLFISHDLAVVEWMSDRILRM